MIRQLFSGVLFLSVLLGSASAFASPAKWKVVLYWDPTAVLPMCQIVRNQVQQLHLDAAETVGVQGIVLSSNEEWARSALQHLEQNGLVSFGNYFPVSPDWSEDPMIRELGRPFGPVTLLAFRPDGTLYGRASFAMPVFMLLQSVRTEILK